MLKPVLLAAALWLGVTAASAGPIQKFTVADLQAAAADAASHGDNRHGKCWVALLPVAQQWQSPIHIPTAPGLASLAQTYFDAQGALNKQPLPDDVLEACAETVHDLRVSFARLAALVGVRAIVPSLPNLLP